MSFLGWLGASIVLFFSSILGTLGLSPQPAPVQPAVPAQVMASTTSASVNPNNAASVSAGTTTILDARGNPTDYLKDQTHVYLSNGGGPRVVQGADPATFTVISNGENFCDFFGKDESHVYWQDNDLENYNPIYKDADPTTFQLVLTSDGECSDYEKDDHHVFYGGEEELPAPADPTTFTAIALGFGKDASQVYYRSIPITGADSATFVVLGGVYSKDHNHIYVSDPQSEETSILSGADVATFQAAPNASQCGIANPCTYDAQDKNHEYLDGQVVQ